MRRLAGGKGVGAALEGGEVIEGDAVRGHLPHRPPERRRVLGLDRELDQLGEERTDPPLEAPAVPGVELHELLDEVAVEDCGARARCHRHLRLLRLALVPLRSARLDRAMDAEAGAAPARAARVQLHVALALCDPACCAGGVHAARHVDRDAALRRLRACVTTRVRVRAGLENGSHSRSVITICTKTKRDPKINSPKKYPKGND
jgi:hypothetical protein